MGTVISVGDELLTLVNEMTHYDINEKRKTAVIEAMKSIINKLNTAKQDQLKGIFDEYRRTDKVYSRPMTLGSRPHFR